jgi:hypothetical protein
VNSWVIAAGNLAQKQGRRAAGRLRWSAKVAASGARDAVHALRRGFAAGRDRGVNTAKSVLRTVRRPIRVAARRRSHFREQLDFYRVEWGVEREIRAIVERGRPIVLGPWLSEVGYETLYWLPFLHWLKEAYRIEPARLIAVSRGGVGAWYAGIASRYIEIWDHIDPAEFARRNAERGTVKQYERSAFDRDLLAALAPAIGTDECDVVHPGLMYRLFALYWSGHRAMGFVDAHTRFTPVNPARLIDPALLPPEYIAVKFYAARSLPDTPAIRATLAAMVARLAERVPVVLLDTGLVLEDDHADYTFAAGARVIAAKRWMTPQNNLGVQTQIVAGARAFLGTCGSIAWLAPRLGVDTSAVFVDPKWLHAHLAVAMRAYHKMAAGRFAAADLRALDPLGMQPDVLAALPGGRS